MSRPTAHPPKPRTLAYAVTGVLAAIGGIASAHLVAGLTNPAASPDGVPGVVSMVAGLAIPGACAVP